MITLDISKDHYSTEKVEPALVKLKGHWHQNIAAEIACRVDFRGHARVIYQISTANTALKLIKINIDVPMCSRALDALHHDIDNSKGDVKGIPNFHNVTTASELRAV